MRRAWINFLAAAIALIWLTAILSAYYVYHKPISLALGLRLLYFCGQVTASFCLVALGGAVGRFVILRILKIEGFDNVALQAALGLGGLGLIWLAISVTLGVTRLIGAGFWLALSVLLFNYMREWLIDLQAEIINWKPVGKLEWSLAIGSAILLLMTLIIASAPPIKFDALVYHLALPQTYLDQGRMAFVADNPFWGMPQNGEMLFTWCLTIGGLTCAAILGWMCAVLALLGLGSALKKKFGSRACWIGVASLLAGFTFSSSTAWAYIDWFGFLYGVGMLVTLEKWVDTHDLRTIGLAGGFAGLALGSKYTAGALVLAGTAALITELFLLRRKEGGQKLLTPNIAAQYSRKVSAVNSPGVSPHGKWEILGGLLKRQGDQNDLLAKEKAILPNTKRIPLYPVREAFQTLGLFLGVVVIITLPWWVKNWLATGHFFYPIWGRNAAINPYSFQSSLAKILSSNWLDTVFLPFGMTIQGVENAPGYSASVSPLLLGLAPFAFWGLQKRSSEQKRLIRLAALTGLSGLLAWMVASRAAELLGQTRLYYALFPSFTILTGAGYYTLERLKWSRLRLGRVIFGLVLLVTGLNVLQVGVSFINSSAYRFSLGLISEENYLTENLGWHYPAVTAIRNLPAESRVLLLWEARSLYCLPRCSPDPYLDTWRSLMNQAESDHLSQAIKELLLSEGYTHILYYKLGAEFIKTHDYSYQFSDWQKLDEFLAGLPQPLSFGDVYLLYSLK